MINSVFEKNIKALGQRCPGLVPPILSAISDSPVYSRRIAKNGQPVPAFADGVSCNSTYDPGREAAQIAQDCADSGCVVFAGLGGGYHVREYLSANLVARCLVAEAGYPAFRSLLEVVDLSDILTNPRVTVVPDCADENIPLLIASSYLPALHGNFRVVPLRPWQMHNEDSFRALGVLAKRGLEIVSADYSVQAHFGRLWMHNAMRNLQMLPGANRSLPEFGAGKKAVVAAAGPGLEDSIPDLRARRSSYVIFSTDTAYGTLVAHDVIPDAFVSIDAQLISARHAMHGLKPSVTVIMDLCGNPEIARVARAAGCELIITAGSHPLSKYAMGVSPLPEMDTSSGTVTVAALDAAHSCGFSDVVTVGADFAYVAGKPYARGTYLERQFYHAATRLVPAETAYDSIMFRTPVRLRRDSGGITYTTDVLDRYADAFSAYRGGGRWTKAMFRPFPYERFISLYSSGLSILTKKMSGDDAILFTLLPFVAWRRSHDDDEWKASGVDGALRLASDLIAGYTATS